MGRKRTPRTIALDFDGVLHSYQGYRAGLIQGPVPGALQAVQQLQAAGHTVVVFTTRPPEQVVPWLARHGFPALEVTDRKRPFFVLVDDRAVEFRGGWTPGIVQRVANFKPYWWGTAPPPAPEKVGPPPRESGGPVIADDG